MAGQGPPATAPAPPPPPGAPALLFLAALLAPSLVLTRVRARRIAHRPLLLISLLERPG
jgi:hypothetical protein